MGGEDSAFSYVRIKYGSNATDTVTGAIIYPDDFSFSEVGVATMKFGAKYAVTQIDAGTWQMLEEAGCVFLPSAGRTGYGTSGLFQVEEDYIGPNLYYWSSTGKTAAQGGGVFFSSPSRILSIGDNYDRNRCFSVRLVQDL